MTLGFGSTEAQYEQDIERTIRHYVADLFTHERDEFFSDSFCQAVKTWLDKLGKEHRDAANVHDTAVDFPGRYSYFWPTVVADASNIVFIIRFSHINRRHPASPDDWAMMGTKKLFDIYVGDLTTEKQQ